MTNLKRSPSTFTTLSGYIKKTNKYQRALDFLNVILLLGAICLNFYGAILR